MIKIENFPLEILINIISFNFEIDVKYTVNFFITTPKLYIYLPIILEKYFLHNDDKFPNFYEMNHNKNEFKFFPIFKSIIRNPKKFQNVFFLYKNAMIMKMLALKKNHLSKHIFHYINYVYNVNKWNYIDYQFIKKNEIELMKNIWNIERKKNFCLDSNTLFIITNFLFKCCESKYFVRIKEKNDIYTIALKSVINRERTEEFISLCKNPNSFLNLCSISPYQNKQKILRRTQSEKTEKIFFI